MNILVINGSPKGSRSNTYRLTRAFLDGMIRAREQDGQTAPAVEELEVNRLHIKPCLGCFSCWNKTPGTCCIRDDMSDVIEKLLWADITVWSFPLYYFNVPGQLKTLIDRQLPMCLPFMNGETQSGGHPSRYDMSGKRTVLISTCGFYTAAGNYDSVTAMFDRFCGKGAYTTLFCGEGELFRVKELSKRTDEYLAVVREAGEEYERGGITDGTQRRLTELLYPRETFEAMADASWGVNDRGEKEEESLIFTRQMAALYNRNAYPGQDIILEMDYTDIGKTYRVILGKDGSRVTEDRSGEYTTRIRTPYSVWCRIAAGELSGAEALMKHLYQVEGDFDLMLHWGDYFSAGTGAAREDSEKTSAGPAVTNMKILLLPWTVFWVAAAIDGFWGCLVSLAVCVLVPVIFFQNRKTIYDVLSAAAIGGCCLALLAGVPAILVLPLSYLLFGVMWSASCLTKVPLTAWYSMNGYGGEKAWKNPIFIRTNRILTAAWGILYLLTPIWTYRILQTRAGSLTGAVNSILPVGMGIFTVWFQKWYPGYVAGRGGGNK